LILALALRLALLPFTSGGSPMGDSANYIMLAKNIIAGNGIVIDDPWIVPNLRAFYPPGYPVILGAVGFILPIKASTLIGLNLLIDVATAAAILWLARLSGSRHGEIAAAAWLLWPSTVLAAPLAQKEGLVALLFVLTTTLTLYSSQSQRLRGPIGLGVAMGLLALTQPSIVLLPAFIALVLFREFASPGAWFMTMAIAALSATAVLIPWWIRNYLLFDTFVPLTTASGLTLWIGIQPGGQWVPAPQRLLGPELEMSRLAGAEAWAWIKAHPGQYVYDCLVKGFRMLFLNEAIPLELAKMRTPRPVPVHAFTFLTSITHFGLIAATAIVALKRSTLMAPVLVACLAYFFALQIWFVGAERLRGHMTPIALVLVAGAAGQALAARKTTFVEGAAARG
jgi:4-amino-4-deoxy-L-arabinose transferase-like glycosyltransferase